MAPPADFSDLSTAYNSREGKFISVIGVVVDFMPPTVTRNGEHMVTFKLLDPRLRDALHGAQGMTVRFFKGDPLGLPQISKTSDIVLVRYIKVMRWAGQILLISNYQTSVLVFPAASIPEPQFQIAFRGTQRLECRGAPRDKERVTAEEQAYIIALKSDMKDVINALPDNNEVNGSDAAPPAAKRIRLDHTAPDTAAPLNAPTGPAASRPRIDGPTAIPTGPAVTRPQSNAPTTVPTGPAAIRTQNDAMPQQARPRAAQGSSFGPKFRLVKDLKHYDFADVYAEVVKKYPLGYGGCDLYVTDYTSNEAMWYYTPPEEDQDNARDGDMFGYCGGPPKKQWPGPFGWLVLKVNVKEPHAGYINRELHEGDFVFLQNVKMKVMNEGSKLEGDMWPDSRYPEKIQVKKLQRVDDGRPENGAILQRKEKYWAARKAKTEPAKKKSRTERKAEKKKKLAAGAKKAAAASASGPIDSHLEDPKSKLNQNVRCHTVENPTTHLQVILDADNERHTNTTPNGFAYTLPFINAKYRALVRVVDFEPKRLEDFAILADPPADDHERSSGSITGMDWHPTPKWTWNFRLLLEEVSGIALPNNPNKAPEPRLWANLDHFSAQYLLGDLPDPADLRASESLLNQLREKMFYLWGNLEEKRADESLSNKPFDCCIQEYGVKVDEGDEAGGEFGWVRMYGLFGVTIT